MRRIAAAVLFAIFTAIDVQAQTAGLGEISISADAQHFDARKLRAGALLDYASAFDYFGVAAQTTHYTQAGWKRDAPAVLVLWRKQNRDTLAGTMAEAGVVRIAGRTRLIGDATWSLRPARHTGVELLAAADLVETQPALEHATAYTFGGVSAERELASRFTVIGLAGYQRFSDGNERVHLRGRLIWMLIPEQGLSAQLRVRQYRSRQLDVGGAYFNPGRYREWQAGLAMRKRAAGWLWSGTLAAGREQVDGDEQQSTLLAEVRAEGTLGRNVRLALHASYNRSSDFAAERRGYWYRVVGVTLIVPF